MVPDTLKNQNASPQLRDSNIELYRIISMLLIIAHHYVVNSGLTAPDGPIYADIMSFPSLFLLVFGAWGKIGINCFVLITGYFMCKSRITLKKFVKLLFEVMFYRVVINSIFWISGYANFSIVALVKILIPIISVAQNFTGTYLIFFLCIPFLNVLIGNLSEKQHLRLILLTAFIYVFFGTVPFFSVTMNYVSWYTVLYFIASYVRLYPKRIFGVVRFWGIMTAVSAGLSVTSVITGSFLGSMIGKNLSYRFVIDSNTFLAVLTGFCSFMLFKNIKIKQSKFINTVSSTTFGVFLIHANSETMRQWLWGDVLDNVGAYGSPLMPLHAVGSVLAVFVVCSLIDLARISLVEKPFFRLWDKRSDALFARFGAAEAKLFEKLGI